MLDGKIQHLLYPVYVGGKAGHHQFLPGLFEDPFQGRLHVLLGQGEPRHLGVGGVHQEQIDPLSAEPGETTQVGDPSIQRQLVHLEVAGVQHGAAGGPHKDRHRVRDRVVDRDEFQIKGAEADPFTIGDRPQRHPTQPMFAELLVEKTQGQPAPEYRDVATLPQQVWHGADVVLMAMGQDQRLDIVEPVGDCLQTWQDQVDSGMVVFREQHPAVDQQQPTIHLEAGHVAPHITQPAQRDYPHDVGGEWRRRTKSGIWHVPQRSALWPGDRPLRFPR